MAMKEGTKAQLARDLGVSRSLLYYEHKQEKKDWELKCRIEKALRKYPSYGHKRLGPYLRVGKNRTLRVMNKYGIKPYRRRTKKIRKIKDKQNPAFPNWLLTTYPARPNHIWASDFTHIPHKGKWLYLATVIDLYSGKIVGFSLLNNHSVWLIINALFMAVRDHPIPEILHSDQGSEYKSKDYTALCAGLNIKQSMSQAGCPWENGYQESFYSQFKVDLGDPNRFDTVGELADNIYKTIYIYNHSRIHTKLKMPPVIYGRQYDLNQFFRKVS